MKKFFIHQDEIGHTMTGFLRTESARDEGPRVVVGVLAVPNFRSVVKWC